MNNMNGAPTIEQYNGQSINPEVGASIVAENSISSIEVPTNEVNINSNPVAEAKQTIGDGVEEVNKQVTDVPAVAEIVPGAGYKFSRNSLFEIAVNDKANNVSLPSTAA